MNQYRVFLFSMLAVFVAACASNSMPDPEPMTESEDTSADAYEDNGFGGGEALPKRSE